MGKKILKWYDWNRQTLGSLEGRSFNLRADRKFLIQVWTPPLDADPYTISIISVGIQAAGNVSDMHFTDREQLKELADLLMKAYHEVPDVLAAHQYQKAVKNG